jgi:hypothetical protein
VEIEIKDEYTDCVAKVNQPAKADSISFDHEKRNIGAWKVAR